MPFLAVALTVTSILMVLASSVSADTAIDGVRWTVPEKPWDARQGNHRAVIRVPDRADAVRVHLPWRRRDRNPHDKAVWIIDPITGKRVRNTIAVEVNRELGEMVFQPPHVGEYHVYYMPYEIKGSHFPSTLYDKPEDTADEAWVGRHGLTAEVLAEGEWRSLPQAEVVAFEARTEWDRMDPMEVSATADEVAKVMADHPGDAYLLFPEDRRHPIRMTEDVPLRWVEHGPSREFRGEALRNEFYVFQLGLFAARADLDDVRVSFEELRSPDGATIPASALRCFNAGGVDWLGRPFAKEIAVPRGNVQALWVGIDVPRDLPAGAYGGAVTVAPADQQATRVRLSLAVSAAVLEDCGDSELWRLSRLRWLDSTIGLEDRVTAPYTPLEVESESGRAQACVRCLGRTVVFGAGGLPESIRVGGEELLAGAVRFEVEAGGTSLDWLAQEKPKVVSRSDATVVVESAALAEGFSVRSRARMEFDGYLCFRLVLKAERDIDLDDCRLEIPLRERFATYMMGMGCKGGFRPEEWQWKWDVQKYQDSVWLGDVAGGLQLKLKGPNYRRPLGNIHYHRQPLLLPEAWHNAGKGGCTIGAAPRAREEKSRTSGGSRLSGEPDPPSSACVVVRAFGGARKLTVGQELRFDFDLLITPVKPLNHKAHWQQRYFHGGVPKPDDVVAKGASIINIHHGNEINPFINYPFLTPGKLGEYVRRAHEQGVKVKLYYTIRELTNHVAELFALRSLGEEIFVGGDGGGHAWLHEHLVEGYAPAWHHPFPDGVWCCSISQTGLSRWHNYYLEGLAWLCRNLEIDGLYLDEIGYDREIMKRVRRVLDKYRPGALLDLHSWNHFNERAGWANCLNLYMEHMPYLDSLWIGEGRNYNEGPDHWMVEISGIPFGLFSEMLQGGGNPWRGMLYGMTNRLPWSGNPAPIWKLWDDFGIAEAEMLGYWKGDCPVTTDCENILSTVYRRNGKSLVCLASWEKEAVDCKLSVNWQSLGLDPGKAVLYAPEIEALQGEDLFRPTEPIPVEPGGGWMFIVDETPREPPAPEEVYAGRTLLMEETFAGEALDEAWTPHLSQRPGINVSVANGELTIDCTANTCAFIERALPAGTRLVECQLNSGADGGQTWGVGLGLVWPDRFLRLHLRAEDKRYGYDDAGKVMFGPSATPGTWQHVRIRIEKDEIILEGARDRRRKRLRTIGRLPRSRFPGDPIAVRLGKMDAHGQNEDFPRPGRQGKCSVRALRVFGGR